MEKTPQQIFDESNNFAKYYYESGYRVIELHQINRDGSCSCNTKCSMAGKHPVHKSWQQTPMWSLDQFSVMLDIGSLDQYGVILCDHLVIDIDPRNGGDESYERLVADTGIDFEMESGFVVATGGGGKHLYFNKPKTLALKSKIDGYKGIDFKSSGYVVGCGSKHASGLIYEQLEGFPSECADIPQKLLDMLHKQDTNRGSFEGGFVDVSNDELHEIIIAIGDGDEYERWIAVGMAIHHTTDGSEDGFNMWDEWSRQYSNYEIGETEKKWHGFGRSANPMTLGTLMHLADSYGYKPSFEFELTDDQKAALNREPEDNLVLYDEMKKPVPDFDVENINLKRPGGFIGELAKYFRENARRERDYLAVASALSLVGNLAGLRYTDEYGTITNSLWMAIADSGTGKDGFIGALSRIYTRLGLGKVVNGNIRSEQEIYKSLVRDQMSLYVIDEIGHFFQKLSTSGKSTSYLTGIPAALMNVYSKVNDVYSGSSDFKIELMTLISNEIKHLQKKVDKIDDEVKARENESPQMLQIRKDRMVGAMEKGIARLEEFRELSVTGIYRPFLSMLGFSTSIGFDDYFSEKTVKDGFLGRMLIVREMDSAPPHNDAYRNCELPDNLFLSLNGIVKPLALNDAFASFYRIQYYNDRDIIKSTKEAYELLTKIKDYFQRMAEWARENNGYEALYLRAHESVAKVSLIMAVPEQIRTVYHVKYAFTFVVKELNDKINMVDRVVNGNARLSPNNRDENEKEVNSRILSMCGDWTLYGTVVNKAKSKKYAKHIIEAQIDEMIKKEQLVEMIEKHSTNGKSYKKLKRNDF